MNVNSNVYGNAINATVVGVGSVGAVGAATGSASRIPPAIVAAATATISRPGQLFADLQQLSQQDPAQFKTVATELATSFQNAASQTSGPQAKLLTDLSSQLNQAAQTGNLQPLQAAQGSAGAAGGQGAHQHHHHHGGGYSGGGTAGQSSAVQQAIQSAMSAVTEALQSSGSTGR
ncbi:MAG TPA: hypothetical protein VE987_07875 [Polyangiaceae bacterium]|nr:hypothetical protein [Polyangiaceae bacterium]